MSAWMESILSASRDAAILAVAIGCVIQLSGQRIPAGWRHGLWLLVAVRLLMPILPVSPFSWQRVLPETQQATPSMKMETEASVVTFSEKQSPLPTVDPVAVAPSSPVGIEGKPAIEKSQENPITVWEIVAGVWICGVIGLLLLGAALTWRFQRRARRLMRSHPKGGDLEMMLETLGRDSGWRNLPRVQVTEAVEAPALFGLLWPRILMPPTVLDRLSDTELRLVLLHELGHWKRRDLLVNSALALLQAVHWFNPLVWWAFHRTRLESERATDDWVLRRAGAEHVTNYGEMLLRLLDQSAKPRVVFSGMVSVVESPGDLRQRMVAIARFTGKRSRLAATASAAILLGLAAVGLTQPPEAENVPGTIATHSSTEAAADSFNCRVHSSEDAPVPDAEVYLQVVSQLDGQTLDALTLVGKTDGAGEIKVHLRPDLRGSKNATIKLFARHPNEGYAAISRWSAAPMGPSIELSLSKGLPLRFRMLDQNREPIPGMRLRVMTAQIPVLTNESLRKGPQFFGHVPALPDGFWSAVTDAQGRCSIEGMPSGQFYVDHDDPRYGQIPGRHDSKLQYKSEPAGAETELELLPAATVSGNLRLPDGTPVEGAKIETLEHYSYQQGGCSAETLTDARGHYELQRLLPSDYDIRVTLNKPLNDDWTADLTALTLRAGEQRQGLDLSLSKGGLITGKVTLADTGAPVRDILIGVTSNGGSSPLCNGSVTTNENGSFRYRFPPGKRKVYVAGGAPQGYTNAAADESSAEVELEVRDGGTSTADFALPRESGISGVVIDPSGKPVAGANVTCLEPKDRMGAPYQVISDEAGKFSITFTAGAENAQLVAAFEGMVTASGVKYPLGEEAKLELKGNGFASASGQVVDQDGKPLEGVLIRWAGEDVGGIPSESHTDAEGRYQAAKMLPGKLIGFYASKDGFGTVMAQADLNAGQAVIVETMTLAKATSSVAGNVVDAAGNPVPGARVEASGYLQPNGVETSSDQNGRFELHGLVDGWLDITATKGSITRWVQKEARVRTGKDNLLIKLPEAPVAGKKEKLVDFVGKPAPPLKAQTWFHSDPLPENQPGKVRLISFVGLDRPLIFFPDLLPVLQKFRDQHSEKELEIIVVHGFWPKEEVAEILAKDYPDFKIPLAIEPEEGAMSQAFGAKSWLTVVIDQKGKVAFQSPGDLKKAEQKVMTLLGK